MASLGESLGGFLQGWRQEVQIDDEPRLAWRILWRMRRTKWIIALGYVWNARNWLEIAMTSNANVRNVTLMQSAALHLAFASIGVFADHVQDIDKALDCFIQVARSLERGADPSTELVFSKMVRRQRKIGRFTFAAFVLHTLASWQTINGAHRISPVNAALAPAIGPWYHTANWVFYSIQGWIVVFGLWAYYRWLALVCTLFGASAALYRGLVIRSPSVQGLQLRELAAQHSLLQQGVRWSRRGLEGAVVVVVLCCAALPLAATVHLALTYHHDPRPLGKVVALLFRLIANALVLLCFAGDELERESQSLMQSLYDAPWLEESPSDRLTRRNFMQGAEKGVTVAVRSLGHLNRPFCLYVIEKWFSVLQVLIKIQGGGGNS